MQSNYNLLPNDDLNVERPKYIPPSQVNYIDPPNTYPSSEASPRYVNRINDLPSDCCSCTGPCYCPEIPYCCVVDPNFYPFGSDCCSCNCQCPNCDCGDNADTCLLATIAITVGSVAIGTTLGAAIYSAAELYSTFRSSLAEGTTRSVIMSAGGIAVGWGGKLLGDYIGNQYDVSPEHRTSLSYCLAAWFATVGSASMAFLTRPFYSKSRFNFFKEPSPNIDMQQPSNDVRIEVEPSAPPPPYSRF